MARDRHAVRSLVRLLVCAAVAAAVLVGCGPPPDRDAPDGTDVTQDGVRYSVQTSRELDPLSADDRAFLGGIARRKSLEGPDVTLVGVFLQARNDASAPRRAVAAPRLVTAFGETFTPLRLPQDDPFAYRGRRLAPRQEIPGGESVARESPENGALVVYRVPTSVFLTDRPFTVRFGAGDQAASVQLDL
jgi:hypothetical protein